MDLWTADKQDIQEAARRKAKWNGCDSFKVHRLTTGLWATVTLTRASGESLDVTLPAFEVERVALDRILAEREALNPVR
jgi:hypothetical protein